jgi:hypothetical protein
MMRALGSSEHPVGYNFAQPCASMVFDSQLRSRSSLMLGNYYTTHLIRVDINNVDSIFLVCDLFRIAS